MGWRRLKTETNTLWQNFLDAIYKEIHPQSFHVWFKDLLLLNIDDYQHKIRIQVQMEIQKKVLGDNYYNLIEDTLFKLTGINYEIEFLLEEETSVV